MEEKVSFSGLGGEGQGQPAPAEMLPIGNAPETGAADSQANGSQPTGLTEAQIRKIIAEETGRALETARRTAQSMTAKAEQRIKNVVEGQLAMLKQAGVQATPEQAQAIEKVVRQQMSQPETTETEAAQPEGNGTSEEIDPTTQKGYVLMDAMGVDLNPGDPEAQMLDMSSEAAFLKTLARALQTKAARLATNPAARTPAGGGGAPAGPVHSGMSGSETLDMAYRQFFRNT